MFAAEMHFLEDDELSEANKGPREGLWARLYRFHQWVRRQDFDKLRGWRYYAIALYRFVFLLAMGVHGIGLTRRASSLTFTTILAIFPLLAVAGSTASFFLTAEREAEFMLFIEDRFLPSTDTQLALAFMEFGSGGGGGKKEAPSPPVEGPTRDPGPLPYDVEAPKLPELDEMDTANNIEKFIEQINQSNATIKQFVHDVATKFRSSAAGAGVFGFLGLLITTGVLYWTVETTVNEVWHTEHLMNWVYTVRNFITALFLAPIVIAVSISSFAIIGSFFMPSESAGWLMRSVQGFVGHFGLFVRFVPLLLVAAFLALAYSFIPVAKVRFRHAFFGGLIASVLWEVARNLFYFYIVMSTVNKTLQDALGLSIVFLIWLYVSWLILLLGNQVVYVSQNFRMLWAERATAALAMLDGRMILATMVLLARRFAVTGGGMTEFEIRRALGMHTRDLMRVVGRLRERGFISELKDNAWQIAHPLEQVSVREVLGLGGDLASLPIAVVNRNLTSEVLRDIQERSVELAGNESLADLLDRVREEATSPPTASDQDLPAPELASRESA